MNTDLSLLDRYARRGDPEAFAVLVRAHQALVFNTCRRILGDAAAAEDAAQDTFLLLSRQARTVRSNVAAWLHRTATNLALRRSSSERARDARERIWAAEQAGGNGRAGQLALLIDQVIDELPATDRILIVRLFLEKRSQTRVAAELGIGQATVSRHTSEALARLRERLAARGIDGPAAASPFALLPWFRPPPELERVALKNSLAHGGTASVGLASSWVIASVIAAAAAVGGASWWALRSSSPPAPITPPAAIPPPDVIPPAPQPALAGWRWWYQDSGVGTSGLPEDANRTQPYEDGQIDVDTQTEGSPHWRLTQRANRWGTLVWHGAPPPAPWQLRFRLRVIRPERDVAEVRITLGGLIRAAGAKTGPLESELPRTKLLLNEWMDVTITTTAVEHQGQAACEMLVSLDGAVHQRSLHRADGITGLMPVVLRGANAEVTPPLLGPVSPPPPF